MILKLTFLVRNLLSQWLWYSLDPLLLMFSRGCLDLYSFIGPLSMRFMQQPRLLCMSSGQQKEHLRVLLLRIESTLFGLRACLPDFPYPDGEPAIATVAGAAGVPVGSSALREEAADTIHQACE